MTGAALTVAVVVLACIAGCREEARQPAGPLAPDAQGHTAPSQVTADTNAAVARTLPLLDEQDFRDAERGLIASDPEVAVTGAAGRHIWNTPDYAFVAGNAPASVNPSLWRASPPTSSTARRRRWSSTACGSSSNTCPTPRRPPS